MSLQDFGALIITAYLEVRKKKTPVLRKKGTLQYGQPEPSSAHRAIAWERGNAMNGRRRTYVETVHGNDVDRYYLTPAGVGRKWVWAHALVPSMLFGDRDFHTVAEALAYAKQHGTRVMRRGTP